jgi:hypothetical protein
VKAWISGRPAPFATAGERPWKEAIAAQVPASTGESSAGMVLDFSLREDPDWPGHPDVDNLCEPVFTTVINRLHWFGGSRTNLVWYLATKRPAADLGALVWVTADPAPKVASVVTVPNFTATWPGSSPSSARDAQFLAWVQAQGASVPEGQLAVALEFGGSSVNIGDVATGAVKHIIDCLQPVIGGRLGNPDDHRFVCVLVVKDVSGVPQSGVRITLGQVEPTHAQAAGVDPLVS